MCLKLSFSHSKWILQVILFVTHTVKANMSLTSNLYEILPEKTARGARMYKKTVFIEPKNFSGPIRSTICHTKNVLFLRYLRSKWILVLHRIMHSKCFFVTLSNPQNLVILNGTPCIF